MAEIENVIPSGGRMLKENSGTINIADKWEDSFGGKGFTWAADTNAKTPPSGMVFCALQAISNTVLSAITTVTGASIVGTFTGVSIPAGAIVYIKASSVTLTSGSCILYHGVV